MNKSDSNIFKYKALPIDLVKTPLSFLQRLKNFIFFWRKVKHKYYISRKFIDESSARIEEGYIEGDNIESAIFVLMYHRGLYPITLDAINKKEAVIARRIMNLQFLKKAAQK